MFFDKIALTTPYLNLMDKMERLAKRLGLPIVEYHSSLYPLRLVLTEEHLELQFQGHGKLNPIYVDFLSGKSAHRKRYGGGKGQLIARAVGIKGKVLPNVLDLSAGLGNDAFVLASLGCEVTMLERSPIIAALLQDGLTRAKEEESFSNIKLRLIETEAALYLKNLAEKPTVIYFDPMFPELNKSALVKKEMRILRAVVGEDIDAGQILELALTRATKRIVVKRARLAPTLTPQKPDLVFPGKSCRYDVYLITR